ncbi:TetR/AcrR family transcriptional regulator [Mycobacterium deserti]|uniref:TetR/AcrR family transcriptional regulator n=1 Tax=Mycobacterium deserti TaxID=2978347 RepID=A0ABT2MAZ3_9MYCO|nr:TetR/AcrR family transcriptional regulator [Mycobacterium deserti]MCT7659437.1 TetR/AcrR family transcriptional regulator [Mycobacterium deserti]
MGESSIDGRRRYDNSGRQHKAAQTRERIITAGSELVHGFDSWNWRELTFRAVAERAGVGERTVYRHFPTERHLHDAVMARLESEAGISYEDVNLANLQEVTGRVFASLQRFSVRQSVASPPDSTFVDVDERRRDALRRAVSEATPHWSDAERRIAAGLLDVLWNLPSYERLVGGWGIDGPEATRAIGWLMAKVLAAIDQDDPPPA